jgi:hypothetical protein
MVLPEFKRRLLALWLCGFVALWLCGFVALWLCGFVLLWLSRSQQAKKRWL